MNRSILILAIFLLALTACAPPPLPTATPTILDAPSVLTPTPTAWDAPQVTETVISGAPTIEPTLATLQLAVYPPETRTANPELDPIINAMLGHDFPALKSLTTYLQIGCTNQDGLGGPPKCQEGEAEGTILEVVPFLGPEGHHTGREDFQSWQGPDVLGLLAAFRNSSGTYSDPAYPAGEYSLVFLLGSGVETLILQVRDGKVIRYDYHYGGLTSNDLEEKAENIILPLSFNPVPTPVPWDDFQDTEGKFSFLYPPTLELITYDPQGSWQLGNRIKIEILSFDDSWITCFYQALGDCPFVETDQMVDINGQNVRQIEGYIGAVGGNTPQEYLVYIFPMEDQALVFSIFALPFGIQTDDPSIIWPLEGIDLELFERTVKTVTIK